MDSKKHKWVGNWVLLGVALLTIQVLIGGITRLTGSGLSITEWKPIMGALPPLNESDWQKAFEQYQHIAQYKYLNNHFTLSDFKFIFFWEWFHRLWARMIAVAFLIPFIYFLYKKWLNRWIIQHLIGLFLFGAFQGLIGWIMVKSGLNDDNLYVNHIKLAFHFVSAMGLISYALYVGLQVKYGNDYVPNKYAKTKNWLYFMLAVTLVQLSYGAFMAGLKAASAAPTWPSINGMVVPDNWFANGWVNALVIHKLGIHFIHRGLAYTLLVLAIVWAVYVRKLNLNSTIQAKLLLPCWIVFIQVCLGIATILLSPNIVLGKFNSFEWIALIHQLTGMVFLLSLIRCLYLLNHNQVNTINPALQEVA